MSEDLIKKALNDPLLLQQHIIEEFEGQKGQDRVIGDPNNTFVFVSEMMSRLVSNSMNKIGDEFNSLYPRRAANSDDLFRHMADYEYVGIYASPAAAEFVLYFDKDYINKNARMVVDEEGYPTGKRRVTIPESSMFNVGEYEFGIYYPINIDINPETGIINSYFDIREDSTSIRTLERGTISNRTRNYEGINVLTLNVPMYQMVKTTMAEPLSRDAGFDKVFDYDNKFYAVQAFYKDRTTGEWTEMNQTLAEDVYSLTVPTVYLSVHMDRSKLRVRIPQIYFTQNKLGDSIRIELYTTRGSLDVNVDDLEITEVAHRIPTDSYYSTVFKAMPMFEVTIASKKIVGGSNNYSFPELQERVTDGSYYDRVPITTGELVKFLYDHGFEAVRYRDGVTDRVYFCYKRLTDGTGVPMSAGNIWHRLPELSSGADGKSIVYNDDWSYMLLPSAIYELEPTGIGEYAGEYNDYIANIGGKSQDITKHFNRNPSVFCPMFTRIYDRSRYPLAYLYNFAAPKVTNVSFVRENRDEDHRVSIKRTNVDFVSRGFTGHSGEPDDPNGIYNVHLYVESQGQAAERSIEGVFALVVVKNGVGRRIGQLVEPDVQGNKYVVEIPTDFKMRLDETFEVGKFANEFTDTPDINIMAELEVHFIKRTPEIAWQGDIEEEIIHLFGYLNALHLDNVEPDFGYAVTRNTNGVFLNHQNVEVRLGERVTSMQAAVRVEYTSSEHDSHEVPIYARYTAPIYKRDENGALIWNGTGISEWDFEEAASVYNLTFNSDGTAALAETHEGSDPADIIPGMAVESKGGINDLIYVNKVEEDSDNIWLYFNDVPGLSSTTVNEVAVDHPVEGKAYVEIEHRQDDWIFGEYNGRDTSLTVDSDGKIFMSEDDVDHFSNVYEYEENEEHPEGVYLRPVNTWICINSDIFDPGAYIEEIHTDGEIVLNESHEVLAEFIPGSGDSTYDALIGIPLLMSVAGYPNTETTRPSREIRYAVKLPSIDGKYMPSNEPRHRHILTDINRLLESYRSSVSVARDSVLEYTDLFYCPYLSVGSSDMVVGNGVTMSLPLDFGVSFRLYIGRTEPITVDEEELIRNKIIEIIDEYTESGTFSCSKVAIIIMDRLSDYINNVDIGGLYKSNGEQYPVETLIPKKNQNRPNLRRLLRVNSSGDIWIDRDLQLEYTTM